MSFEDVASSILSPWRWKLHLSMLKVLKNSCSKCSIQHFSDMSDQGISKSYLSTVINIGYHLTAHLLALMENSRLKISFQNLSTCIWQLQSSRSKLLLLACLPTTFMYICWSSLDVMLPSTFLAGEIQQRPAVAPKTGHYKPRWTDEANTRATHTKESSPSVITQQFLDIFCLLSLLFFTIV